MKKRFILGLIICFMFLLMACGKEEGTGTLELQDSFTITGRGVVVTGKVTSGVVRLGDTAVIVKENGKEYETKVMGIEKFRVTLEEAVEGDNIGVLVDLTERIEITDKDKMIVYGEE